MDKRHLPVNLRASGRLESMAKEEVIPDKCPGCATCGGSGRILGGLAAFPLTRWWPIKAYKPCPNLEDPESYQQKGNIRRFMAKSLRLDDYLKYLPDGSSRGVDGSSCLPPPDEGKSFSELGVDRPTHPITDDGLYFFPLNGF
eukprot:g24540.t1